LDIELELIPVDTPIDAALQAIPPDAEAVYITPLLHLTQAEWNQLVSELNRRRLPTFSMLGIEEVELGVLATMRPETFFPQVARRVALNIQRILLEEEPGSLPVFFDCGERLTINMETARTIGRFPNWDVLSEAELLNYEEEPPDRVLSISRVAHEALEANLDLLVQDGIVSAGAEEVRLARSNLLPQVEASATGLIIDKDRAEASFGAQAERTLSGGVTLTQLFFSDPAWANLSVQQDLQSARRHAREETRMDVILDAVTAYLDVLRTRAIVRVQRENVVATRSNLELARVRREIGTARAGEVLRWESQIAVDRNRVISADAQRLAAEVAVNRILHRPQEERFGAEDLSVVIAPDGRVRTTDPSLLTSDERLAGYGMNPLAWDAFRDFMVEEGLALSPEIMQLDAAIAAQERLFQSSTRAFWAPTVALQGSLDNRFSRNGAGSTGFQLQDPPAGFPIFPSADDFSWTLGLSLSIPLLNGGSRLAGRTQASKTLRQLQIQREAVAERIEQRIRTAAFAMGSSYMNIGLSAKAAQAARENLDLVRNAYAQGAVSIIELLDAQNATLAADEAAAIAVYVFAGNHMRVERAVGRYDFFMTEAEREEYFQRLDEHFARVGVVPAYRS
jgi:outer membrane protein TolC